MHQPSGNCLRTSNLAGIAVLTISFAAILSTVGCGNQYRPVVSAIGPVGPAGQPAKYAVAVSSPSATSPGLVTFVDFSGDTVISTPQIVTNPSYFVLNTSTAASSQGYVVNTDGLLDLFLLSNPATLLTSNVTQTTLTTGAVPISLTAVTPASGIETVFVPEPDTNSVAALNASTTALYDTVRVHGGGSDPVYVVGATGAPRVYVVSQNTAGSNGQVDSLETVSTSSLADSAQIPVGIKPVYGVMTPSDLRAFILNEGSGTVSVLNVPSNELDVNMPTITVGTNPVWADLNNVSNELTVLNQGNGTNVSAQNVQGVYSATTTYPQNAIVSYVTASQTNQYIALNGGLINDPPTDTANWELLQPGSLSIINIPLCNSSAQATNPNCSATNPVDATGFGQVLKTVPVGIAPTMVSVLQGTDGNAPAAYVINQLDSTGTCGAGEGSVTVVDLASGTVTATICGVSGSAATATANGTSNVIFGHPNSVSATGGEPTGKVYVTSSDNQYLSVIYTNTNTVETHIPLQGNGLRVLVTAP